jgi:hypothetical protein
MPSTPGTQHVHAASITLNTRPRPDIVPPSFLNAALRQGGISNATEMKEIASFVPPRDGDIENYINWRHREDGDDLY